MLRPVEGESRDGLLLLCYWAGCDGGVMVRSLLCESLRAVVVATVLFGMGQHQQCTPFLVRPAVLVMLVMEGLPDLMTPHSCQHYKMGQLGGHSQETLPSVSHWQM